MQSYNKLNSPPSFIASNTNISIAAAEIIVLNNISVNGFYNFSLTITNAANSAGNVSVVKVYGSNDGVNYFTINASILSSLAANTTTNATFTTVAMFIRVSATSASTSNLSCYLVGVPS